MYRTSSTTYSFASSISTRFVTWVRMMIRWAPQQPQGNSVRGSGYSVRRCSQNCGNSILGRRGFRRVRGGGESALASLSGLLLGIQPLDDFGHEKQLLIGRGCIPLATLAEHRPLEEPQLLGGLRQLLLVCGDGFLLLGDDRRLWMILLLRVPSASSSRIRC